ncbi:MAG TPA: isochorismatase family protein [Gemmatimonadales bacterium]|nr:isochorismatase family protein [Gemmatimonadales bacterium]
MKTVHFDIDTQIDFMFPSGALYVPGAERLLPRIEQLNRYALDHGLPLVSTMCAHSEDDPEFQQWPPHCIVGTIGQRKPDSLPAQIILEKQKLDLFTSPKLEPLLAELKADRYVVYGVVTEYCVKCAALGLLKTGKPVTLITDAIQTLNPKDSEAMIQEFTTRGGELQTVQNYCVPAPPPLT